MIAYFDCFSGISGDMTMGAFIDMGVPVEWLQENLSKMPIGGFHLMVEEVFRHGISAKSVEVQVADDASSRDYGEIVSIIQGSDLSDDVKTTSLRIFDKIAEAEAKIHKCEKEKVHFHEVGAVDSIVDIVGAALCIEYLGITRVVASKIPLGTGFVQCRHGKLPVPAPATLEILRDVPVYGSGIEQELVTPTGAAIITTLAEEFGAMPEMIIENSGYGAGRTVNKITPNLLRVSIGNSRNTLREHIVIVETCIDDMNPEVFGYLMERLFDDGALDVYWIPIFMKKNRPGTMIQVICDQNKREVVIYRILTETSTLGVRYYDAGRYMLERKLKEVDTSYGMIPVKQIKDPNGTYRLVPEYEVCKKIALEKKIPLKVVYEKILHACAKNM